MCGLFKVLKYENHSSALTLDWSFDLFEEDAGRRECTSILLDWLIREFEFYQADLF